MKALWEKVVVGPDGVIQIRSPELPPPGTPAEVVVIYEERCAEPVTPLPTLIGAARGMFLSPKEADDYLNKERDSWES
jgi:hypothetical protein